MKLFEDGDPCFAPMLNALFAAFRGTAVMSGCEVSATGTSRTVSITAGSVQINGEVIAVGAGSVTLDAGSTFDRYDLVSVNASGSKIVTKGATKRKCPTQPANTCLLAIVFVPAGATVIATGNVYDARMLASTFACRYIVATRVRPVASDEVRWGPKQNIWTAGGWSPQLSLQVVIPSIYTEGTAKLTLKGHPYWVEYYAYQQVGIKVNGVSVAQWSSSDKTLHEYVYPIKGGDVIVFWSERVWGSSGGISDATVQLSDTAPIIYPAPPTWPA